MRSEQQLTDYLTALRLEMDTDGKHMEQNEFTILSIQIETMEYCLDQ